jgi:tetratricopeptide (TPR) repeat protein
MPRLDQLLELLQADPTDTFLQYAVAMEHAKQGDHEQALAAFNDLLARDPKYVAAYFMAGRTCEQKEDPEAAKAFYRRGIDTANSIGDSHAAGEMSSALMMLE